MKTELMFFIVAVSVGIFIHYMTSSTVNVIMKFPNPSNSKNLLYVDDNNVCYKYKSEEIPCPMNSKELTKF